MPKPTRHLACLANRCIDMTACFVFKLVYLSNSGRCTQSQAPYQPFTCGLLGSQKSQDQLFDVLSDLIMVHCVLALQYIVKNAPNSIFQGLSWSMDIFTVGMVLHT